MDTCPLDLLHNLNDFDYIETVYRAQIERVRFKSRNRFQRVLSQRLASQRNVEGRYGVALGEMERSICDFNR